MCSWDLCNIATYLLNQGADVNWKLGKKALTLAIEARSNSTMIQNLLLRGAKVNYRPSTKVLTPLQAAARRGEIQLLQILLDHGAEVNAESCTYFPGDIWTGPTGTALQIASAEGHISTVQFLLQNGADINMTGTPASNSSALTRAAERCRLDVVQLLINAGADQHLPLSEQCSSALRAAQHPVFNELNLGVINLLQRYRDEAQEKWDSLRVLEMV